MRTLQLSVAVVLALAPGTATEKQIDPLALQRMVATERAFAAATAEVGVRDGFLSFFADDAIQIRRDGSTTIVPARAALAAQPLQKLPIANQLIWEPYTGHMSSDGTLGWLTGGFVQMNQAQRVVVGQGAYFSVWKRQTNGTWRVWLDEGISLPDIWMDAAPFRVAPEPDAGSVGAARETVDDVEASIATESNAWRARLGADVRLHVDGRMPAVGRDAVIAASRTAAARTYRVLRVEAAASGDLAVTVGALDLGSAHPKQGSWVRVWKRELGGRWRIVFQTENVG